LVDLVKLADEQERQWREDAFLGEAFETMKSSDFWLKLEAHIFTVIEKEALSTLKNPGLNLSDANQFYQVRALAQSVDLIRSRVDRIISYGKAARENLLQSVSTLEEQGENHE
jgi:uncharacterized protein YerC